MVYRRVYNIYQCTCLVHGFPDSAAVRQQSSMGVTGAWTSRATQNIGRLCPLRGRACRTQKEAHAICFCATNRVDHMLLFCLTTTPIRRNPRGSQSPTPACGCCAADVSASLRLPLCHQWPQDSILDRLRLSMSINGVRIIFSNLV